MEHKYYRQLTAQLRRKGIEDSRIVSTLNDVKGWVVQHPDEHPATHFGPAAALVRDLPKGNAIHTPQKFFGLSLAVGIGLVLLQIVLGFFNIAVGFLGLPAPLWGLIVIIVGFVISRCVGGQLPENFRP